MLNKYYEQYGCVGVLPPRAYYVPFSNGKQGARREQSDEFISLCGEWKLDAYETIMDVEDDFYAKEPQDVVPVPLCLQTLGYDYMQYTNANYPFPFNPPYTSNRNPAFHYRKTFVISDAKREYFLNFEGVDSCFYLYVNDEFVGFSQITHRVSEFDVTPFVKEGENKLDVLVLKWCAGSYLEDQDKLRFTGIFRDVYILSRPVGHITDYHIVAGEDGVLKFTLVKGAEALVKFGRKTQKVTEGKTIKFVKNNPRLWSAETPYLYDLYIFAAGETIKEEVGFRSIRIEDRTFLFNSRPVKLLGVNRHDNNPFTGATVTYENMVEDLALMKKLNINCIRTSHYPSMPEFYRLCDKFGFYVVSESDVEGHGVACKNPKGYGEFEYSEFGKHGEMYEPYVMRQQCNILVNFNRPCVTMWSFGNETGYGYVIDRAVRYMRTLDDTRLIHYERINNVRDLDPELYHTDAVDMANRMYPSFERITSEYLDDPDEFRPYFLCEYAHSMGNGPGDIYPYADYFFSDKRFMGGCIWEWADHGTAVEGKRSYRYGGDFGETLHDSNFCMDGLVTADRKLKAGSLEAKKAYQPLVFSIENGALKAESRNFFATLTGTLKLVYKNKGEVVKTQSLSVAIGPRESMKLEIDDYQTLIVSFDVGKETVAFEGFNKPVSFASPLTGKASLAESGRYVEIKAGKTNFRLDKATGEIVSVSKDGKEFGALRLNIYRAPTDNDRNINNKWKQYRLHYARSQAREVVAEDNVVTVKGNMSTIEFEPFVRYELRYSFYDDAVKVEMDYAVNNVYDQIPRIGFTMKTGKEFDRMTYYGYPSDSYKDIHHFAPKDMYEERVKDSFFPYDKPQESGSHYDCSYACVKSKDHAVSAEGDGFCFAAIPYSDEELRTKAHFDELKSDGTYIHFDFFMQGIGSNSCGPQLAKESQIPQRGFNSFTVRVK